MDCKCGAIDHRTTEKFENARTAHEASGREITRLPCIVVKNKCNSCGFGDIQVWYPEGSKPLKPASLLDRLKLQPAQ